MLSSSRCDKDVDLGFLKAIGFRFVDQVSSPGVSELSELRKLRPERVFPHICFERDYGDSGILKLEDAPFQDGGRYDRL